MGILQSLGEYFISPISIYVSSQTFVFVWGNQKMELRTLIFVDCNERNPRVVAVGEEIPITSGIFRIDLFDGKSLPDGMPGTRDKLEFLEAFIRYGVRKTGIYALMRPRVIVHDIETLDGHLQGYQTALFRHIFERDFGSVSFL